MEEEREESEEGATGRAKARGWGETGGLRAGAGTIRCGWRATWEEHTGQAKRGADGGGVEGGRPKGMYRGRRHEGD